MRKTLIYIDVNTGRQVSPTGEFSNSSDYVTIERGQWQILCIQLVDRYIDSYGAVAIRHYYGEVDNASLVLVGDNDFTDTNDLMFKSYQNQIPFAPDNPESNRFNIEGDWIGGHFDFNKMEWVLEPTPDNPLAEWNADLAQGQISVRINANTQKFVDVLSDKYSSNKNLYMQLKRYVNGMGTYSTLATLRFVATNTIRDWNTVYEEVPEGLSVTPFVDSYMRNPIEVRFSRDRMSWHATQQPDDKYFSFKIKNTSTEWSNEIELIQGTVGEKGEQGIPAGFGTISASATSVPASSGANVTVYTSGDDTAKNFTFMFNIPKGEAGAAAGFGTPQISIQRLSADAQPTASVSASGSDDSKVFNFSFGIPVGITENEKQVIVSDVTSDVKEYVQEDLANGSW